MVLASTARARQSGCGADGSEKVIKLAHGRHPNASTTKDFTVRNLTFPSRSLVHLPASRDGLRLRRVHTAGDNSGWPLTARERVEIFATPVGGFTPPA